MSLINLRLSDSTKLFERGEVPNSLLSMIDMGRNPDFSWRGVVVDAVRIPNNIRLLSEKTYRVLSAARTFTVQLFDSASLNTGILTMVWDGLVELYSDGSWVSGDMAMDRLNIFTGPIGFSINKHSSTSWKAIRLACASGINDTDALFNLLYGYGFLPVFAAIEETPYAKAVEQANGIMCAAGWQHAVCTSYWYRWQFQLENKSTAIYKLYVGLMPSDFTRVLPCIADCICHTRAVAWKCTSTAFRALRPDSICIYFNTVESMIKASSMLDNVLYGVSHRAIPLSLMTETQSLTTWGVDPDCDDSSSASWRSWICNIVASSIRHDMECIDAKGADWKKIAFTLSQVGIDPFRWTAEPTALHQLLT